MKNKKQVRVPTDEEEIDAFNRAHSYTSYDCVLIAKLRKKFTTPQVADIVRIMESTCNYCWNRDLEKTKEDPFPRCYCMCDD